MNPITTTTQSLEQEYPDSPSDTKSLLDFLVTLPACKHIVYQEEEEGAVKSAPPKPKVAIPLDTDIQILKFCLQLPVVGVARIGKNYRVELPCSCRMTYRAAWKNFRLPNNNNGDGRTSCPKCLTDVMTREGFPIKIDKPVARPRAETASSGVHGWVRSKTGDKIPSSVQTVEELYDLSALTKLEDQIHKAHYQDMYKNASRDERRRFLSRRYRFRLAAGRLIGR